MVIFHSYASLPEGIFIDFWMPMCAGRHGSLRKTGRLSTHNCCPTCRAGIYQCYLPSKLMWRWRWDVQFSSSTLVALIIILLQWIQRNVSLPRNIPSALPLWAERLKCSKASSQDFPASSTIHCRPWSIIHHPWSMIINNNNKNIIIITIIIITIIITIIIITIIIIPSFSTVNKNVSTLFGR